MIRPLCLALIGTMCAAQTFTVTTAAGDGVQGFAGDGGLAQNAEIFTLALIAVDGAGNLFLADTGNCRVRKVTASTGIISTVAGSSTCGYSGDNGPATSATLYFPHGIAVDTTGNIYIGDSGNNVVRKVDTRGIITTFAGTGTFGFSGDNGLAVNATLADVTGIVIDRVGNVYLADRSNNRIRKVDLNGIITTVVGSGAQGFSGNGGPATSAAMYYPSSITFDAAGNLYIAEPPNNAVRVVSPGGIISLVVGTGFGFPGFGGDGGPAINGKVNDPQSVAVDGNGNIYIGDEDNQRIRMISPNGIITTICGNGVATYSGDVGPSTSAQIDLPEGIAVGPTGLVYFLDSANNRVRVLTPTGAAQSISFGPIANVSLGTSPFGLTASATSGLSVTFTSNTTNVCTVSGSTVTLVAGGACSIVAHQLGNSTYAPAQPVTQTFNVISSLVPPTLLSPANGAVGVTLAPTLTWNASSGATSYGIYFGTSAAPPLVNNVAGTSFSPGTLVAGITYYWQVVAMNSGGTGASSVWSFTTSTAPSLMPTSVNPGSGTGLTQTFTFTFNDPNGFADLSVLDVLINNYLDGQTACYFALAPASSASGYLYMVDDAGDGGYVAGSPMFLPSSGTLTNGQCTLNGTGSSISAGGNTLTLTLSITFKTAFAGNRIFYMAARSNTQNSGWQALGTWNVPGLSPVGPAVSGMTPARSNTLGQTYSFTFTDTLGYTDLNVLDILTNSFLDGISACYVAYVPTGPTTGYVYLVDDSGNGGYAAGSPLLLSSGGTLQNSQCTINTAGSSASASGNTLTLNLPIVFKSAFAGNQVFYLAARNAGAGNSGWQAVGSVTVP